MSGIRPSRREVLSGASAFGSLLVLGCTGNGTDDDAETDDDDRAGVDVGGRSLRSDTPIELVEPDVTVSSGFARRGDRVVSVHGHGGDDSHWHSAPLEVPHDEERTVRVRYLDEEIEELPLGADEEFQTTVELVDPSPEGFLEASVDGDLVTFSGESVGEGDLRFELWRDDDPVWEPPLLHVEVIESDGTE